MATFAINETARRTQFTSTGQTSYAFNFQVNATSEVEVFKNDTLQTLSTHYSVSLNTDGTGTVSFIDNSGSGGTNHTPSNGDIITIIGDLALSRTTVFSTAAAITTTNLDTEFDNVVMRQQQIKEITDRSIQLKPSTPRTVTGSGTSGPLHFPYDGTASNNANRIVKFDSNGTALELGSTTTNIDTLAGVSTEIGLLGNSTTVANMGLLGTSTVVADMALLANSDVIADMALLATTDVIADMNTLATSDIVSDLNTLATSDIVSDLNTLATSDIVSDINTLATSDVVSDLNTLATSDIVSDINTLATSDIVSDLNTLATSDFVSDLNTIATSDNVSNIATVASNVAGVNSFAERYRVASSDPSSSLDAGDLAFNTSSNTLKFYNGSAWISISDTATQVTVADESSDTSCNVLFTTAATGDLAPKSGTNLTFNSSSGVLTATGFAGDLTGNVTGNVTGSSGSCTGNAAGLSSTLAVSSGGTGATSLTANGVLIGNGTSAVTAVDMSTKGSLLAGDGSGNPSTLGVGTNDFVLTADSSEATGLKWAAAAAAGATGSGGDEVFVENERVVTTSYTLSTNKSAMCVGPLTINTGVTVTIPSGERLVIL
jgi:hypothetical protein